MSDDEILRVKQLKKQQQQLLQQTTTNNTLTINEW